MKKIALLAVSVLLVAGALGAVVAMMTVQWLYPSYTRAGTAAAAEADSPRAPVSASPSPRHIPTSGHVGEIAAEVIRRAGAGDLIGAGGLAAGLPEEALRAIAKLKAAPGKTTVIPTREDEQHALVWAHYRKDGYWVKGLYQAHVQGTQVVELTGPLVPHGGYKPLALDVLAVRNQVVTMNKPLILIAPRNPDPELPRLLKELQDLLEPRGVTVALALDLRSPDWSRQAESEGFSGPMYRVRGQLDHVPTPIPGDFYGAVGLLIDGDGVVVGSLAALDASRYGLDREESLRLAPHILQGYGLIP